MDLLMRLRNEIAEALTRKDYDTVDRLEERYQDEKNNLVYN